MLEILDVCADAIQPYELPEDQKININISDCYEWAELLNDALTELQLYKWQNLFA